MPTRAEILETLAASQEQVLAYFQGLSPEALERPCTASGVPGEAAWRAKGHFTHLAANERNIQILLRLALRGETGLSGTLGSQSREERLAPAIQRNQSQVNAHRDDAMEALVADLAAARQETLQLLEQFTDEQLAAPAPVSFVADRTAGELFAANAQHAAAHMTWIEEGLRQGLRAHDRVSRAPSKSGHKGSRSRVRKYNQAAYTAGSAERTRHRVKDGLSWLLHKSEDKREDR